MIESGRLSTIVRADQMLVFHGGEIIERGTHEEVLTAEGLYARQARIQSPATIEEGFARPGVTPQ